MGEQEKPLFVHRASFRNRPAREYSFEFYEDRLVGTLRNKAHGTVISSEVQRYLPDQDISDRAVRKKMNRELAKRLSFPEREYSIKNHVKQEVSRCLEIFEDTALRFAV